MSHTRLFHVIQVEIGHLTDGHTQLLPALCARAWVVSFFTYVCRFLSHSSCSFLRLLCKLARSSRKVTNTQNQHNVSRNTKVKKTRFLSISPPQLLGMYLDACAEDPECIKTSCEFLLPYKGPDGENTKVYTVKPMEKNIRSGA